MFKSDRWCDDALCMSDLSNLLGAVYGSSDPDGPATYHEPSAAERVQAPAPARIDDDLAAALSAALVTSAPDHQVGAPAPAMAAPVYSPPTVAAPALVATAPRPVAQVAGAPSFATAAPAPAPQAAFTPSTYNTGMVMWSHGDDDIFPVVAGKKR